MSGSVIGSLMFRSIAQPIGRREERCAQKVQGLEALTKRVQDLHDKSLLPNKAIAKETKGFDLARFDFSLCEYDKNSRLGCAHYLVLLTCFSAQQQKTGMPNQTLQGCAEKVDKMVKSIIATSCDTQMPEGQKKVRHIHKISSSSVASRSMMHPSYSSSIPPDQTSMPYMEHEEKKSRKRKRSLQERQVESSSSVSVPVLSSIAPIPVLPSKGEVPEKAMCSERFQHLVNPFSNTHRQRSGD